MSPKRCLFSSLLSAVSPFEGLDTLLEIAQHGTKALQSGVCACNGAQKFYELCGTGSAAGLADQ